MKNESEIVFGPAMESAIERLKEQDSICAAFLHGSSVNGRIRPDSDVDIALLPLPGAALTATERLALAGDLEELLHRRIDLGILSTGNLVYAKEVAGHGELLFTKNRFLNERFFMTCLSMYADLQQERQEVLHAYTA